LSGACLSVEWCPPPSWPRRTGVVYLEEATGAAFTARRGADFGGGGGAPPPFHVQEALGRMRRAALSDDQDVILQARRRGGMRIAQRLLELDR
jgi:hypothetical protein